MEKLKIFCGDDDFRPLFHELHQYKQYVLATDAYCIALTEGKLEPDSEKEKLPEHFHTVIDNFFMIDYKYFHSLNQKEFNKYLAQYPHVPIYEDCEQCKGYGEVDCHCCDYTNECRECGGSGHGESTGVGMSPESSFQLLSDRYINPFFVSKALELNEEIKIYLPDEDVKSFKIEAGKYTLFIMALRGPLMYNVKLDLSCN